MRNYIQSVGGILLLLCCATVSAQDVDELIREGIRLHSEKKYEEAIRTYQQAMEILPDSPIINSEIAMSYLYAGDNEKALVYSDKTLRLLGGNFSGVYLTKGSALRNMGRLADAATVFKQGLTSSGSYYMLHYSLGQVYYLQHQDNEAITEFISAITLQPNHGSSHLLLGYAMLDNSKKAESFLSLLYFLLLESETDRSKEAFRTLWDEVGDRKTLAAFTAALEEFFKGLSSDSPSARALPAFWQRFYLPFFRSLYEAGHSKTFVLYAARHSSAEASGRLDADPRAYKAFLDFLETYE